MNQLLNDIEALKHSPLSKEIKRRLLEFKRKGTQSNSTVFSELCFCILTANCSAESCIQTQESIGDRFHQLDTSTLTKKLRQCHYRFPNLRAQYINQASSYALQLKDIIEKHSGEQRRTWLVDHIRGIGYKEASHFLRNIGYEDYGIIDKHIIRLLTSHEIITPPKTITKNSYLHIENILRNIAQRTQLSLAGLDLYLWYMQTGKVLK